jgi:hypothetical protein
MKIIQHKEGVYEIKNFLTEYQQNIFLSYAQEEDGWETLHLGNTVKKMTDEALLEIEKIYKNIESFFINYKFIRKSYNLRRLRDGEYMWPHKDKAGPDDPDIVFGIAIYLNDDYEGGELIYPDLGLSITPKSRSMMIHDASLKHQVFPVGKSRYSITIFVFGDESTKFKHEL